MCCFQKIESQRIGERKGILYDNQIESNRLLVPSTLYLEYTVKHFKARKMNLQESSCTVQSKWRELLVLI